MEDLYSPRISALAHADKASYVAELDRALPEIWQDAYAAMPGSTGGLLIVTLGQDSRTGSFCRYLFDHASGVPARVLTSIDQAEDRVVAVWGTSRRVDAHPRDKARIRGFPKGNRSADDRGHFFAHSMGGGLDINLFPQASRLNRGGLWRRMESYCAKRPGTFCFIRPIYTDTTWRPAQIEYGIVVTEKNAAPSLWLNIFDN